MLDNGLLVRDAGLPVLECLLRGRVVNAQAIVVRDAGGLCNGELHIFNGGVTSDLD